MHPELLALLAVARESPGDPLVRLAVADWLEENGNEVDLARGRYLRLVVADAAEEAKPLAWEYRLTWLGGLASVVGLIGWSFEGGMTQVQLRPGILTEGGLEQLTERRGWPWVDEIHCEYWNNPADLLELFRWPPLADLSALSLRCGVISEDLAVLLPGAAEIQQLARLTLASSSISPTAREVLTRAFGSRLRLEG